MKFSDLGEGVRTYLCSFFEEPLAHVTKKEIIRKYLADSMAADVVEGHSLEFLRLMQSQSKVDHVQVYGDRSYEMFKVLGNGGLFACASFAGANKEVSRRTLETWAGAGRHFYNTAALIGREIKSKRGEVVVISNLTENFEDWAHVIHGLRDYLNLSPLLSSGQIGSTDLVKMLKSMPLDLRFTGTYKIEQKPAEDCEIILRSH